MAIKVVVVGAGMMGSGIGAVSALAGHPTVLVDATEEQAQAGRERAEGCIGELADNGLVTDEATRQAPGLLSISACLEEALAGAGLVIEAVYENLSTKQELFCRLDALLPPDVPILSNTSGLRITDIAAKVERYPQRTMTAHFWLPAHLVPLVEVVLWDKTNEDMANEVRALLASWGKAPVLVKRDLPGQLANRVLQAIIREAVNIVDMGLASAEDVDTAIQMGMGIRLPAWGILEHIDAVGLDLALSVQESVLPGLSTVTNSPRLQQMVAQGQLGSKTGQGFYDWEQRSIEVQMQKRNEFILYALKKLRV